MPPFIAAIDDGALWLAAVVAGLTALGWLFKRAWQGYRHFNEFIRKTDVVLDIAAYEMQHNNGGSIKDAASQVPAIAADVAELKKGAEELRQGAVGIAEGAAVLHATLADHAAQLAELVKERHAMDDLAEAMPIVARSTPHECDAPNHEPEEG